MEAEISIAKDFPGLSIGGFASGMTKAEILTIGYFNEQWGATVLREGANLELTAGGWVTLFGLKYELDPYFKKIPIF